MKITYKLIAAIVAATLAACTGSEAGSDQSGHSSGETEDHSLHDHDHDADHQHHDGEEAATTEEHAEEIILAPAVAARLGVKTAVVTPGPMDRVINVAGEIVVAPDGSGVAVAPTSGILTLSHALRQGATVGAGTMLGQVAARTATGGTQGAVARASVEAARKEVERMAPLAREGIISAKEFNAAKAAYEEAKAAQSESGTPGRVASPIAGVITQVLASQGQFVETGQPIAVISKNDALSLRADVPERYRSEMGAIRSARFKSAGSDRVVSLSEVGGRLIGSPMAAASVGGYYPIYFSFDNSKTQTAPGTMVEVFLLLDRRDDVISVPVEALTEQLGNKYVYVKIDEEGYEKRPVTVGAGDGRSVEIAAGLEAGDEVVVAGATVVRLAENSGKVPEGHSHNH